MRRLSLLLGLLLAAPAHAGNWVLAYSSGWGETKFRMEISMASVSEVNGIRYATYRKRIKRVTDWQFFHDPDDVATLKAICPEAKLHLSLSPQYSPHVWYTRNAKGQWVWEGRDLLLNRNPPVDQHLERIDALVCGVDRSPSTDRLPEA